MSNQAQKLKRPPVVVVMGHVDHGKTTLLDFIRKSNVAAKEAGGITQAVGAYEIEHSGQKITFIDTPGHEAFMKMRERGAKIADIAILVVAADDSVQPQTQEAIRIATEAKIPFVVAINKIDKNNADIERVKADLAKCNVLVEGFGGSISFQPISAKTGEGVNDLLDLVLLAADVDGHTYDPAAPASGFVLEAHRDSRVGTLVTIIVKNGTLKSGELIYAGSPACPSSGVASGGTVGGKIKGLKNFLGKPVKTLLPSSPAIILGFDALPAVGDPFGIGNLPAASAEKNLSTRPTLEVKGKDEVSVNFVLKADVAGSLEALAESLKRLTPPEGKTIRIIDQSVGELTEGDAKLAASTNSHLVAFNTKIGAAAKTVVRNNHLHVFESKIIYHLIEEIVEFFKRGGKPPVIGELEVLAIFDQKNILKQVIGGKVLSGAFRKNGQVEIKRNENIIGSGRVTNLQRQKKDIEEVISGSECGLMVNSASRISVGDRLIMREEV